MKTLKKALLPLLALVAFASLSTPLLAAADSPAAATRAEIQKMFGFLPDFMKAIPDAALPGAWREMRDLQMSPKTQLPCKVKELIGLAVAAQVPCTYCTYAHTEFARMSSASEAEIGEAVSMAALARHWSTIFNGAGLDERTFRGDIRRMVSAAKKPPKGPAPTPVEVVDAQSARADIRNAFGFLPAFVSAVSDDALPGAWIELKSVEMNPSTALSSKHKSLIGLAVASQIPCRYCVIADTEFAKLAGATDAEIKEAVAMAALTRHFSTLLNGLRADEKQFRADVDRLVRRFKTPTKPAPTAANTTSARKRH